MRAGDARRAGVDAGTSIAEARGARFGARAARARSCVRRSGSQACRRPADAMLRRVAAEPRRIATTDRLSLNGPARCAAPGSARAQSDPVPCAPCCRIARLSQDARTTERPPAAPVQVSYLGYLGTLGASCIDYLIAVRCSCRARPRAPASSPSGSCSAAPCPWRRIWRATARRICSSTRCPTTPARPPRMHSGRDCRC